MGCCLGKRGGGGDAEIEIGSSATNAAVTCKGGAHGGDVKVVALEADRRSSFGVSGSGTALGSCTLECDVGMWECKVGKGSAGVQLGIKRWNAKKPSTLEYSLSAGASADSPSWCFPGATQGGKDLEEGDVVTICWDQTDLPMLSFSVNGNPYPNASVSRIRPSQDCYPALSVETGSSAEFIFDGESFSYPPQGSKFKMIICSTSLI